MRHNNLCRPAGRRVKQYKARSIFECPPPTPKGATKRKDSRKEVIQPHLPVGLPCYDLIPVISLTLDASLLAVEPAASGKTNSHDLTGGVYKARERIHRGVLIRDY